VPSAESAPSESSTIGNPPASGSRIRLPRSLANARSPLRSSTMRPKKPASMKNSDIRKMWLTKKYTPSGTLDGSRHGQSAAGKFST
jgi:hypothetical protein